LTLALQETVEQIVTGLGYELVEIERSQGGLLRVTIDVPWTLEHAGTSGEVFVAVEDCEKVTRLLQYTLEVEEVPYQRLEVSSPGIDRPLRKEIDFVRFTGQEIDLTLKNPMGAQANGLTSVLRKKFRGVLEEGGSEGVWQIVWSDAPKPKPGQRVSKKKEPAALQALSFKLDELKEARLAPIVDFKGRQSKR